MSHFAFHRLGCDSYLFTLLFLFFPRESETGNIVLTYTGVAFFEEFFKVFACLVHFCPATCSIRKFVCMLRVRLYVLVCMYVCMYVNFFKYLLIVCA